MIELSDKQIQILQLEQSSPPTVVNPQTNEEFVLVRREIFERLRSLLDKDFSAADAFRAQLESAAAAGWDDPALDVYNES